MKTIHWERWAAILFCLLVGGWAAILAFRYALPVVLPFLAAWLLSCLTRPMAAALNTRLHIPERIAAPVLLCLLLCGSVWLLGLCVRHLMGELSQLAEQLLREETWISSSGPIDYFETLTQKIGFLKRLEAGERFSAFREQFNEAAGEILGGLLQSVSSGIPAFAGRMIAGLPSALLAIVITVIAGFYFCIEGDRLTDRIVGVFPRFVRERLPRWRARTRVFFKGYVRAYLLLLLLTFAELFLGFCILRVPYAFLLAILIAVVDLLPVLGVGTVLVPWAVAVLLQKNYVLGLGLLILFSAVTILRQITEPKLVGKNLGLHPLVTLFASYAGFRLLGFLGMLAGPVVAMLVKMLFSSRLMQKTS